MKIQNSRTQIHMTQCYKCTNGKEQIRTSDVINVIIHGQEVHMFYRAFVIITHLLRRIVDIDCMFVYIKAEITAKLICMVTSDCISEVLSHSLLLLNTGQNIIVGPILCFQYPNMRWFQIMGCVGKSLLLRKYLLRQ